MTTLFANKALLAGGWTPDVRIRIDAGRITALEHGVVAVTGDELVDIVMPGICNAHSHAFQRALAGHTEQRAPQGEDTFWSWRTRMYALANRIDAQQLEAIATQAYAEMLLGGYTAVAEFHYLLDASAGNTEALFAALHAAAQRSGIRLIYVPVLYERAGFAESAPRAEQRRFIMSLQAYLAHLERCLSLAGDRLTVAAGVHSLRAVSKGSLQVVAARASALGIPLHLHIAEQQAEVEQCLQATGQRPVAWLFDNINVDARCCLVHATHVEQYEIELLAGSQAVVCLCPGTEANLGDGIFPLRDFLAAGGRFAIGSDSQISMNAFEELRWLEYAQRLLHRQRNIAAFSNAHVGMALYQQAVAGGAQAVGMSTTGLVAGAAADLLEFRSDEPMLAGHSDATLLDALVFCAYRLPVERVMVAGQWQVEAGRHVAAERIGENFATVMAGLR